MSYQISTSKLSHPLLKPILEELHSYFSGTGIKFYVIGATARDIIMEIHEQPSSKRATYDLDIAIAISSWDEFARVEAGIIALPNFDKDPKQKQRFIYQEKFELDIVPYGEIMKDKEKIFWPPDESFAMTVLGFSEVEKETVKIEIDNNLTIDVVSLAGIFILKILAWKDRNYKGNKDADDIAFIIDNYLSINEEEAKANYDDIYTADAFTTLTAGAKLLGNDVNKILKNSIKTKERVVEIISEQIGLEEESKLINQIIETNRLKYEEVLKSFENIIQKIK